MTNKIHAVKLNGVIHKGFRHNSIIRTLQENGLIVENEILGYVDSHNKFVKEENENLSC
jgi:protein associated with RNAse G/E